MSCKRAQGEGGGQGEKPQRKGGHSSQEGGGQKETVFQSQARRRLPERRPADRGLPQVFSLNLESDPLGEMSVSGGGAEGVAGIQGKPQAREEGRLLQPGRRTGRRGGEAFTARRRT